MLKNSRDLVRAGVVAFLATALAPTLHAKNGPAGCTSLEAPGAFENTSVTDVKEVPADEANGLPAYCEMSASIRPVAGSSITVVYRLPARWNGKLLGLGGGGWAGNTRLESAAAGLAKGYATAQTNGGHDVTNLWDTAWAANPEAAADFSYRAIHLMTRVGKAVVARYYGEPQKRAYFQGCSTGGRQALMEVQRFPADYDGVISGAPVYTLATQTTSVVRNQIFARPGATLTPEKLKRLNEAALAACDGKDGLADGVIADPRECKFDPGSIQCADGQDGATCLTPTQLSAVRALYSGKKNSAGETVSYGLTRGSELSWSLFISTNSPTTRENFLTGPAGAGLGGLRAQLFGDPDFDLPAFDPEQDYRKVRNSAFAAEYEARDPDISPFVKQGGKLLLWHGMDDPGPSVEATIEYYEQMKATTAPKVKSLDSSMRFFVLPGVYHCRGGPGADDFDAVAALDSWVEQGRLPTPITATRTADHALSRPLCAYPTLPHYVGNGDPDAAASFACR